jgi:two-component system, cell cycle sensor histidine kinase and response regulator CckA
VSDSGAGIASEHLPHIFEPFYTTKEVGLGTGLGLATVEGIVAQSGGRIQVDSAVGHGTTIRLLLPLAAEPAAKPSSVDQVRRSTHSRQRILVVDDEDPVRAIVIRTLQSEGYEVLGARDGREALKLLEEIGGALSLVITDIVMPGMGGAQLVRELNRRYPSISVIWMSGHPRESELHANDVGPGHVFLHKPVAPAVLLDTVAEVLEGVTRN